jgi:1-acyl-sn-glycerol-3-phosphate acyltransferase
MNERPERPGHADETVGDGALASVTPPSATSEPPGVHPPETRDRTGAANARRRREERPDDLHLLLATVRNLTAELHPSRRVPVAADSLLDAELGLDSLALVELRARLEEAFRVELPDRVLEEPTPQGWLDALRVATGPTAVRPVIPSARRRSARTRPGQPVEARTLQDVLAWHVEREPDGVHIRVLHASDDEALFEEITYASLSERARAVASGLRHHRLGPAQTVAIMLPTTADYFAAFFGVMLAGGIPVPIYPPARPASLEEHLKRQVRILQNAGATLLVTVPEARFIARALVPQVPSLRSIVCPDELREDTGSQTHAVAAHADDTALIQYTSGSTGNPKGVVLAHRHLLANIRAIATAIAPRDDDVAVSWLPLYHDMGLIGSWLTSLYLGLELNVMPPTAFLSRPVRWLRAMSDFAGTLSPSPNFGYELCVRHVGDDQLADLDLSKWRMALSGAEPISPETLRRFEERFAPCGFRPQAMTPVYGLAEAGLCVTFPPLDRGPLVDVVNRQSFLHSGRAEPAGETDPGPLRFVACGRPLAGYQVRVVDEAGQEVGDRHEGHIEFAGPSATPGYFHNDEATRALCRGEWRDTGDLGYMASGDLYVTGRSKDIIIRAGRNLHPDELEEEIGNLPDVRKGCVAAFASADPARGTERLVVLAESRLDEPEAIERLRSAITALTVDLLDTPPDDVVIAPPGTVLKTSSGKIRRAACRELYEAGAVGHRRPGARRQLARFALAGASPLAHRAARTATALLYAVYVWTVVLVLGVPTWLLVAVAPTLGLRWKVLRAAGRCLSGLCGIRFGISGDLPASGSCVVVANHASFIDGLAIALALPSPVSFVAGGELATQRVAGPFLRRLGCEFVNEGGTRERSAEATRIGEELRSGRRFVFFPEGSVHRAPGLRPFHLGAFAAAVAAGAPIVPVGISGSRDVVRPGGRFPRRGTVEVAIGHPIAPSGTGWPATVALRDQARIAVLGLSGEPDLE